MAIIKQINIYFIFALCYASGILLLSHQQQPILPEMSWGSMLWICIGYWLCAGLYILWSIRRICEKNEDFQKIQLIFSIWSTFIICMLSLIQFSLGILTDSYFYSRFIDFILLFIFVSAMFIMFFALNFLSKKTLI